MLLLAYLLQRHRTWRRCTLRIFTVVQVVHVVSIHPKFVCLYERNRVITSSMQYSIETKQTTRTFRITYHPPTPTPPCTHGRMFTQGSERDVLKTQMELTHYLQALRIKADVHVVGLDLQDLAEYGEDWTIRRKHAHPPDQRRLAGAFGGGGGGDGGGGQPHPAGPGRSSFSTFGQLGGGASHIDEGSKIKRAIVMHSRDSALVLINLPPPPKSAWVNPMPYFRLVEALTDELQRVIFVYGSGAEVLSTQL